MDVGLNTYIQRIAAGYKGLRAYWNDLRPWRNNNFTHGGTLVSQPQTCAPNQSCINRQQSPCCKLIRRLKLQASTSLMKLHLIIWYCFHQPPLFFFRLVKLGRLPSSVVQAFFIRVLLWKEFTCRKSALFGGKMRHQKKKGPEIRQILYQS